MKPTTTRRLRATHKITAQALKDRPGTWVRIGSYPASYTAQDVAHRIRTAKTTAYAPAGAFETRHYPVGDYHTAVDARYIGGDNT